MQTGQAGVMILCALACWSDLRDRRIPNILTFGGAGLGLLYSLATQGGHGLLTSLEGWLTGTALFFPMFALGGMGAGDVKLAACIGAWLGPSGALWTALYSAIAGGMMAIAVGLATGYLGRALSNVWLLLTHWRVNGIRPMPELTLETTRGPRLAFALPIAAGTAAAIWLR